MMFWRIVTAFAVAVGFSIGKGLGVMVAGVLAQVLMGLGYAFQHSDPSNKLRWFAGAPLIILTVCGCLVAMGLAALVGSPALHLPRGYGIVAVVAGIVGFLKGRHARETRALGEALGSAMLNAVQDALSKGKLQEPIEESEEREAQMLRQLRLLGEALAGEVHGATTAQLRRSLHRTLAGAERNFNVIRYAPELSGPSLQKACDAYLGPLRELLQDLEE